MRVNLKFLLDHFIPRGVISFKGLSASSFFLLFKDKTTSPAGSENYSFHYLHISIGILLPRHALTLPMINDTTKMSNELPTSSTNGNGHGHGTNVSSSFTVKAGLARMLKGGVIMDVVNAEQVGSANYLVICSFLSFKPIPHD
jgi:hypothetical protein